MTIKWLLLFIILNFVSAEDTIVVQWNKALMQAWENVPYYPPVTYRLGAIVHTAMYNAWAPFDSKAVSTQTSSFSRQPESLRTDANKQVAVSYAAYHTLKTLLPTQQSIFDDLMHSLGYDIYYNSPDPETAAGVGILAAQEILSISENDRSNAQGDLNPSNEPYSEPILLPGYKPYEPVNTVDTLNDINYWQPLRNPDGSTQTFQVPHWGFVVPFALASGSQFRPKEGPKATFKDEASFIEQGQQLYDISKALTEEQKLIARYWDGEKGRNVSTWNYIAWKVSERDNNDIDADVKMFFALNNALFDVSIATWDIKRYYNSVRPITLIRHYIDPTWETLIFTPPHADFVAGHSSQGAAAAEIMKLYLGSDWYGGSYTDEETGITLSWETFTDAESQGSMSRQYGGIHFEDACEVGQQVGREVGKVVWEKVEGLINGNS